MERTPKVTIIQHFPEPNTRTSTEIYFVKQPDGSVCCTGLSRTTRNTNPWNDRPVWQTAELRQVADIAEALTAANKADPTIDLTQTIRDAVQAAKIELDPRSDTISNIMLDDDWLPRLAEYLTAVPA